MASCAIPYTLTFVQRLFTTIIHGRPGIGLLLLRLALVVSFVGDAIVRLQNPALWQMLPAFAELPLAGLLLIGLWTPITAVLACSLQLGLIVIGDGLIEPSLQRAVMCLCLSLLGPGHWSIDARLFGRKRVTIKPLHHV
jgi:uncharacterized membrane protein YphA (DoxX/SURF4 family)